MYNEMTNALVCIAEKLTNNKDGSCKIFTRDGTIYIFDEFNNEFTFIYQSKSYYTCDCDADISIKIKKDGTIQVSLFNYSYKKELSERIKRMYNIIMDNLKLKFFWKGHN